MADFKASFAQLGKGFKLPVAGANVLTVLATARVRLYGMFFDLDKCFLLPSAMDGIRGIKNQYDQHPGNNLLVVGHTDTSGQDAYNLQLSLERADAVAAYLKDDQDAWDAFFGDGKAQEKRWGTREIQLMLSSLPEGQPAFFQEDPDGHLTPATLAAIKGFQKSKGLKEDGIAGPVTRKALIADYMSLDGTTLPPDASLTTHGCGENFPAVETEDGQRSPDDRRVEIFIFAGPIAPPPPGKTSKRGSAEYPQWLAGVGETLDFDVGGLTPGGDIAARTFHISIVAVTEITATPLKNAPFKLRLNDGKLIAGITDANGAINQKDVRPGDHELEIAGAKTRVPGVPPTMSNLIWAVIGAPEPES